MKKRIATAVAVFVLTTAASTIGATPSATSKVTTVSLPGPGDYDPGYKNAPNVALLTTNCQLCHSSNYVRTQPLLSHDAWAAEISKMKKVYGAPITDADEAKIVDYLTANYGKP